MKHNKIIAATTVLGTLAVAALYWHVDKPPTAHSDVPLPEWEDGPPSISFPADCDIAWWERGVTPPFRKQRALQGIADVEGYRCTLGPAPYERVIDIGRWTSVEDAPREKEAREIMGFLYSILLETDTEDDELCLTPGWSMGIKAPFIGEKWIRYDGSYFVSDHPGVPAYIYVPKVRDSVPFRPRGGVVLLHGHDAGRDEIALKTDGYQAGLADKLADAGLIVLVPDNVSWGRNNPNGVVPAQHSSAYHKYMVDEWANGLITHNVIDVFHAVTLLTELRVSPQADLGFHALVLPDESEATRAVSAIGISGLSYGAQIATYMLLDERPSAYLVASGLIDTCDIKAHDHHYCQLLRPMEGVMTLWDILGAGALLPRERYGLGRGPVAIEVQQGEKDAILRAWGRAGLAQLRRLANKLPLKNLKVRTSPHEDHTYLVKHAVAFFVKNLRLP